MQGVIGIRCRTKQGRQRARSTAQQCEWSEGHCGRLRYSFCICSCTVRRMAAAAKKAQGLKHTCLWDAVQVCILPLHLGPGSTRIIHYLGCRACPWPWLGTGLRAAAPRALPRPAGSARAGSTPARLRRRGRQTSAHFANTGGMPRCRWQGTVPAGQGRPDDSSWKTENVTSPRWAVGLTSDMGENPREPTQG